ncbi:hypothetical protein [Pleomorphomonas sp. PLEO]|uniref:hypothetical protein n=1 Tax=Pleomorphomonas sp. PLEO TaxID=3239306 RepID=UPI00351F2931
MGLYTKNGLPLQEDEFYIFTSSGMAVGQRRGDKVFGPHGRYVGTIVDDRLVYRQADSRCIGAPFSISDRMGYDAQQAASSATLGDEPRIPQ